MISADLDLAHRIAARSARIGILGLGAVGLPLSRAFVNAGFAVLGFDRDPDKLARLARGENTLHHLRTGLVRELFESGLFEITGDPERLSTIDVALICVPTPLSPDRTPDLECVITASQTLARNLARGRLVVLESTTYPGTTRTIVGDMFRAGGRTPGEDVYLAYSPEREDPGRPGVTTASIPKLVGGTCERSAALCESLYRAAFERVHAVSSAEVAEAAKLLENTFRAVNIALVNELKVALDALSIDVWEVIEAAATKPFGFMKFTPGPGLGGHCIPIDPHYLTYVAREAGVSTPIIELAGEINRSMPAHVAARTRDALLARGTRVEGARVLVLGLAYKPDVDIVTESPSIGLIEALGEMGASVEYCDPLVPVSGERRGRRPCLLSIELTPQAVASFDAVVLATDHAAFDYDLIARTARLVIDTRNALASRMSGDERYVKA